jgi:GAF domain-containing protein
VTEYSDATDVAASIIELQALLLGTGGLDGFLTEVAGMAARTVADGLSCGITLQPDGRPFTVASTDALAGQVDEVQYGLDEGPCLHALRTGEQVLIDDLAADPRWARYGVRAGAHGVRSSFSAPLPAGDQVVDALNLYARRPGVFGEVQVRRPVRVIASKAGAPARVIARSPG